MTPRSIERTGPVAPIARAGAGGGPGARLAGALLAALALAACAEEAPHGEPLNLLVITLDTTRRDFMGFHGRRPSPTPHLDRLAAESVVFEDAFTVAPLTLPAHVSLFTGLYPATHGVRDNSALRLSSQATTLAERLAEAGYRTEAVVAAAVLDPVYGLGQGFDAYDSPRRFPGEAAQHYVERRAEAVIDDALARVAALPEPFALWVHLFDPHAPYEAPLSMTPEEAREERYVEEIRYADAQIGRLLDHLRRQPLWDRLLVLFTADHGEGLEGARERTHGHFVDDETMRIPLLLRDPARRAARIDEVVSLVDVMPTLLRRLGLPAGARPFDGVDLTPLLAGDDLSPREVALESYYVLRNFGWAPFEALVDDERRFVRSARCEVVERGDPSEDRAPVAKRFLDAGAPEAAPWLERIEARFGAPPDPDLVVQVEVSREEAQALAALGYAAGGGGSSSGQRPDFDALPDATTKGAIIERVATVHAALGRGEVDHALELLERSCAEEPESSTFQFEFASTLMAHRPGRWEEARDALERAVELDPYRADALSNLGALFTQRWEAASSEAQALSAAGRDDEARALQREGRRARERAVDHLRLALDRVPDHVESLGNLARLLQVDGERLAARGKGEEAAQRFEEVVELLARFVAVLPAEHTERARAMATLESCRRRLAALRGSS